MTAEKLNKQEIRNEARQLLKQGTSRQETYETLKEKYKYSKIIADIIKRLPSTEAIKVYGKWNYVLLGLLILTLVTGLLVAPSLGILGWYGFTIYVVARMLVKFYVWVTVLGACGLIGIIAVIIIQLHSDNGHINWIVMIIVLLILIPSTILPIWLEKKLCPPTIERKEKYTNSKGQQLLRIVYEFKDI